MTTKYTKFSVLMSLYDKEKVEYLIEAIKSLENQTLKPSEIVIVLDGPVRDELVNVIDKSKLKTITKFIPIVKNVGLGTALKLGLEYCNYELVARFDTDDICVKDRFQKQVNFFVEHPETDLLSSYIAEFEDDIENNLSVRKVPTNQDEILKFSRKRSAFNHPAVMFKKSKVIECGSYNDLRRNQDIELFGRMLHNGAIASNIAEPLVYFRVNKDLLKRRKSWQNTKSYISVINKLRKLGFSSRLDLVEVAIAQTIIFLIPGFLQNFIYKKFLRR